MNIGYDIENIEKMEKVFKLSELKLLYNHLRSLISGLRTRQSISNCVLKISEKLKILNEMAQEIQQKELTKPYVISQEELDDIEDLGEFKSTIKNILKPSRTKSVMMERLMDLVRLFHSVNFRMGGLENVSDVENDNLGDEDDDFDNFEEVEDVKKTESIIDTENDTESENENSDFEENEPIELVIQDTDNSDWEDAQNDNLEDELSDENSENWLEESEEKLSEIEI